MSKINLLSSKIYNRIAAGEVVERPASVVKELVENSIDAGATTIFVEIESGGISSIKITDNGSGIERSELNKALLPHATSKISSLKDLDNIISLGFRGEALASIASVSKITIQSKPKAQEMGAKICADGGEMGEIIDCGMTDGTIITVNNLFFNTPAREKFLKTPRSEEGEISSIMSKFILGNPNISFKFIADGKTIYQSFGDGLESAFLCIHGVDTINECFYIDTEKNGIKVNGYIGKHHFTKGNRTYQTIFINGRYIINQTISASISNAYASYLMKRQYPFYVLNISLPTEIVDVNVHPNKLDVRFSNNQIIYGTIYSIISKVLDGSSEALNIISNNQQKSSENVNDYVKQNTDFVSKSLNVEKKNTENTFDKIIFSDVNKSESLKFDNIEQSKPAVDIFAENKAFLEKLEQEKKQRLIEESTQERLEINREFNYIGQVLNTYLILDDGQDVYFVDQHAAHERILFDKINQTFNDGNIVTQPLLLPYVLNVNNEEADFLAEKIVIFGKMGIEMSEFGRNSFKISAVPTFLSDMNLEKFFSSVLSDLNSFKAITINDILQEKLAQKACKSAIKSGDKLSEMQITTLIDALKQNIGLKCPHGRPVAIKITRTEIDKWFKRIL